ncbi:MAG: hypothetical protein ACKORY_10335, partial [Actinomycetota bacterium]
MAFSVVMPSRLPVASGRFGVPVLLPVPGEYVADGAARQAAWVLRGSLPQWPVETAPAAHVTGPAPHERERYAEARGHW